MHRPALLSLVALAVLPPLAHAGISDNSFFVEEAYNQEAGVVQHVQTLHWVWDREGSDTARWFVYAFTQEWPLGGVRHQLAYTIPYIRAFGDQPEADGFGDVQVHYRFQAVEEGHSRPAVAPRLSLYLPVGDPRKGLGTDSPGFELNLPVSKQAGKFHFHMNAGATVFPSGRGALASGELSPRWSLFATNFGASAILLLHERFNLLAEFATRTEESIGEGGEIQELVRTIISPGARYAINRKDGGQWVFGAAAPIGLSDRAGDLGAFLYTSFEHPF